MAIRDLVSFLKRRASGVAEVLDTMGFDDSTIDRSIQIPVTSSMRTEREEIDRSVAATGGAVDEGLAALVPVHPARGTAAAMGERWAGEMLDADPFSDTCLDCNSPLTGSAFQCADCRGCTECCACDMLTVGLV